MKKILILLSILLFTNFVFAEPWEKICYVDYRVENNVYPWDSVITIYQGTDVLEDKPFNNLLSFCEEGDILSVNIFVPDELPLKKIMVFEMVKTTNAQLVSSIFISDYCDLKETVIVSDSLLVCRLEKR